MFDLTTAIDALNGHDEFVVKRYDGLVVLDYIVVFPGSFDATHDEIQERAYYLWLNAGGPCTDSEFFWLQAEKDCKYNAWVRRNLRGATFNEKTNELISLPLHKFFNVNQTSETQFDLHKHRTATIYEKMDGSMIHFFKHPDGHLLASTCRSAQTPQAVEALRLANKDDSVKKLILESIDSGWTPIFEFVGLQNQIVVRYEESRIVYLISRNRKTGEYRFDDRFPDKAPSYLFNFADVFSQLDRTEFEGYVCHLSMEDGSSLIVKAKTPWYLERHRAVDALMRPAYKLYGIVFEGVMDDLIALATESYKPALLKIYEEAQRDLLNEKLRIEAEFEELKLQSKSQVFAEAKSDKLSNFEKEIVMMAKSSKLEAIKLVRDFAGIGLSNAKKFVETGVWPHGFIQQDEAHEERRRLIHEKSAFADLAKKVYPDDFSCLMSLYEGSDPEPEIKSRLLEGYREKYPNKLYASLDVDT